MKTEPQVRRMIDVLAYLIAHKHKTCGTYAKHKVLCQACKDEVFGERCAVDALRAVLGLECVMVCQVMEDERLQKEVSSWVLAGRPEIPK